MLNSWLKRRAAPSVPAPILVLPSQKFEGNDGPWSSFSIQIGTPPQLLNVLISTRGSQTWAVVPAGCIESDAANCSSSRGGTYSPNASSTWKQNQDASGGLFPLLLESNFNNSDNGLYGYDTVTLGGQGSSGPTLAQQTVAGIATKSFYLGLFGLSPYSSPLPETNRQLPDYISTLNESNLIPSLSWSYTAGNQYRPGPAYGGLILGGYDTSRFEPNDIYFPLNGTNGGDLVVNIGAIFLETNSEPTTLMTENQSIPALVDSTIPYMYLPLNVCQQFEEAFGITWDKNVQAYLVNDTMHNTLLAQETSVVLNLGNSSTIPGQGINISLPYSAFDLTADAPLVKNSSRYFPLMRAANESQYTLGRTFLQEAYLIADYERKNFSVSQCTWDTNAKSYIVPIKRPGDTTDNSHGLSPGAIAGISIGAAVVLISLVLFGIYLWRKRGKKTQKPQHIDLPTAELDSPFQDPYTLFPKPDDGYPKSPELESVVHKGHELDGIQQNGPQSARIPLAQEHPYELDASERRSRMLSSISSRSQRSDAIRLHQRQLSDPVSQTSEMSESDTGPKSALSGKSEVSRLQIAAPAPHASDPSDLGKGHNREVSDPVSLLSERPDKRASDL